MRFLTFLIISITIAYAVDIAPRYVKLLSGEAIEIAGNIQRYREPCIHAPLPQMVCTDTFRIPKALIHTENQEALGIGLGIFISASEIYCVDSPERKLRFGDLNSPARALELLKTYQTVDLRALNCADDLIVDVWGPPSYRRTGYVGSPLVVGEINTVEQTRRVVQFFTTEFHFLLAIGLLSCLLITRLLIQPLIRKVTTDAYFEYFSAAWVAFAIVKSGLPEIALPIISTKLIYIRSSNFISSIAHLGPAILALSQISALPRSIRLTAKWLLSPLITRIPIWPLHILIGAICLSPLFGKWLGIMTLICIPLYALAGLLTRRPAIAIFALTAAMETAKLYNFHLAPYGSTTLTFVSLILFDRFLERIRHGARISELLMWSRSIDHIKNKYDLLALLKNFGERFGISRITLLEPRPGGSSVISIQSRSTNNAWTTDVLYRDYLPSVFSHVLTTREALWNVHQDSDLATHLRKGHSQKLQSFGDYFTVVPILKDGLPIGALSFTSYSTTLFEDESNRIEFSLGIDFITSMISKTLWSEGLATSDEWYRLCVNTSEKVLGYAERVNRETDLVKILEETANVIFTNLGTSVFLARVNSISREYDLKVTQGFNAEVSQMYADTRFYALAGNTQGPMPLAINRGKIVTVADLSWLYPVLHPKSLAILQASDCKSAAAVPIFRSNNQDAVHPGPTEVWGIIWLESKENGKFSPNHEPGLRILAAAIEALLAKVALTTRALEALSGLVRSDIAARLLKNESVREPEFGFLLIADVRGSTRIANQQGANVWNEFITWIRPAIERLAAKHKLQLQIIVWDAFHFTTPIETPDGSSISRVISFATEMNTLLDFAFSIVFPDEKSTIDGARARFCLDHGDTTRDIQNGTWTITGNSMANACKLEGACKPLAGWFFLTEKILPSGFEFELLEEVNPGNGSRIATFRGKLRKVKLEQEYVNILAPDSTIPDSAA